MLRSSIVYNDKDTRLGSVDDVLVGADGQAQVILSANDRLVAVPWSKVQFGNAKLNSDNKVILPDETAQSLKQMPPPWGSSRRSRKFRLPSP